MSPARLRRPRTWRGRLLLAFIGLLVPVSVWEVYDLEQQYARQEAEVVEAQVQTAQALATGLDAVLNDLRHNLAIVAHQFDHDWPRDARAARERLAAIRPLVWPADVVCLVDARGTVIAAEPDEGRVGRRIGERPGQGSVLRGNARWYLSPLLRAPQTGRLGVAMLHAVAGPRGGAVLGWLDAASVGTALGHVTPPEDTVFAVIDGDGQVVYHSRYPDLPRPERDWSRALEVREALAGRVARVPRLTSASDGEMIGATAPVPGVGWAVGVFRSRDAAMAPVVGAMQRGLVQAALLATVLAGMAWVLATRIARPVQALQAGAEALGDGRLEVRVPDEAPDELGRLGRAFNAMAERLGRQMADLESARVAAEAAERRSAFLAEASTLLGASLDYEATLAALADLAVPVLADWCVVHTLDADGAVVRIGRAHRDRSRVAQAEAFERLYPVRADDASGPAAVIRTGRPEYVADVSDDLLAATVADEAKRRRLREFRLCSYLCVPLRARDRVFGALTLVMAESGRRHSPADLAFAEDLARRAALFVDNARLLHEAQAAAEAARDAVRTRDAFLARASHELRTPLTSALGTVRLLKRVLTGTLPERPEPLLEVAVRNLSSMAALINDLLDASKLAAGRESIEREAIPLGELVAASVEIVAAEARERGIAVERRVPERLVIVGDRLKLEQVLVNLLANAVKFTPSGGRVVVSAATADGKVVLDVRDTGEGIARDHLERIFEPFFQTGGRGRRSRGTGLGLAICRQIVTLHGGTIHAESGGPGQGSTFVVRLPASATPASSAGPAPSAAPASMVQAPPWSRPAGPDQWL